MSGDSPSPATGANMLAQPLKYSQCPGSHGVTNFPTQRTGLTGACASC
jgi:hypothetical protein